MSTVQGSGLSPTLCLIDISDLCDNINSRVRLFPAGTTYCTILNAADSAALHQDFQAWRAWRASSRWILMTPDSSSSPSLTHENLCTLVRQTTRAHSGATSLRLGCHQRSNHTVSGTRVLSVQYSSMSLPFGIAISKTSSKTKTKQNSLKSVFRLCNFV